MSDTFEIEPIPLDGEENTAPAPASVPEPQVVYTHDEASLRELRDEIGALRDLFSRRLMNDKQKNELIQTVTDGANYAFIEPFLYDIILLLDRIERSEDETVRSIRDELLEILERRGVEVIKVASEFDPKLYKAVRATESEEITSLRVTHIVRQGYTLSGRVIRPAEVVVARPKRPAATAHEE